MNTNFNFTFSPENSSFEDCYKELKSAVLPTRVFVNNKELTVWGYFSSYDSYLRIYENNLTSELQEYGFSRIANSDCEYLLFVWDKRKKILRVGVDNTASLPCYFSIFRGKVFFTSDFGLIKDVVSKFGPLVADLDGLLTYATNAFHVTDKTLLESVKLVSPGCVAEFNFEGSVSCKISSCIDIDKFFDSVSKEELASDKEFAKALEDVLTDSVARRLEKIPRGVEIGCEVSSGFDCTIVAYILSKLIGPDNFYCYSFHFPQGYGTESLEIIQKFVSKHSLKLRTVELVPDAGYAKDYFELWEDDSLLQLHADYFGGYIRFLEKYAPNLLFTGQHGDELYSIKGFFWAGKYCRQMSYFDNVRWLKKDKHKLLWSKKGVELLLSRDRFNSRGDYPCFYSDIHLGESILTDQIYRNFGRRLISPYLDLRVLSLGMRLKEETSWDSKQAYFRCLDHIFIPEMFIPKKGGTDFALGFPRHQKRLISWVMQNSVLAFYGLIDVGEIMKMMEEDRSPLYQDPFVALVFEYLVRADWYLIKNNIRLSI
ncbi:MAG: asparagine synthase C-terminal domain-containing protein [Patescibacteria group bacterium]|nr:asparagine synthase C-terminal domain-containing protein [Patescibacteria group bacterium]